MNTVSRRLRPRPLATFAALLVTAALAVSCASFPDAPPQFTVQPSLSPVEPQMSTPTPSRGTDSSSTSPQSTPPSSPGATSTPPASSPPPSTSGQPPDDPCAPTDPAVVATCLDAPWGLAPLPDGNSALVGERTTGKIFTVSRQSDPILLATIEGVDATGDGGLLGIALSPYYAEDGLIYAYVTTATDNRILRIAAGDAPKAIFTGVPNGHTGNGGPIAFGRDRMLYVATGDAGDPAAAKNPASLAGKVLRLDGSGKPAAGNPAADSPIFASGLSDPTGACLLSDGTVGVVDHRAEADVLLVARAGRDYLTLSPGDALWTYQVGAGGAVDCAISADTLISSSLNKQQLTSIQMTATGGFTGTPQPLAAATYGRLLTVDTGPQGEIWFATSNKDGHGTPVPSDDRVVMLPAASSSSGGGGPD